MTEVSSGLSSGAATPAPGTRPDRAGFGPAVVVLSPRLGAVLPADAVARLRDGVPLWHDTDLPADLAARFGSAPVAEPSRGEGSDPAGDRRGGLLLTLDPGTGAAARWAAEGAVVLRTPEPAGVRLLDAVAVMDRLRSPGGCPWDAEQTHRSLMPYLIEETYELYQALEDDDRVALREELGDVLLQVLFHARVAQEGPRPGAHSGPDSGSPHSGGSAGAAFGIDEVAEGLVTKLIGRHPHVFAGSETVRTAADQEIRWEQLKRTEKRRESSMDGVALAQPAAALAAKLVSRALRAGVPPDLLPGTVPGDPGTPGTASGGDADPGEALLALVGTAKRAGHDPEAALRTAARRFAEQVRAAERSAREAGLDPGHLSAAEWRRHWPAT